MLLHSKSGEQIELVRLYPHYGMTQMKLLFLDKVVGTISEVSQDGPEMWASFEPGREAAPLLEMWSFITNENNYDKEPPFPEEYLEDESWEIVDGQGIKHPVYLPAVYENGDIAWRWRRDRTEG